MVCQGNLKWGTASAIGVALVDLRMQSSTPAVVPGAALPRPRLGRVGGFANQCFMHVNEARTVPRLL